MATAAEITKDDLRDLISRGWTPPVEAVEPYRHLLRPFYDAKGWHSQGTGILDSDDARNIVALIAVFDHFGIALPDPANDSPEWMTVLRAYVAEHDGFTTEDALVALGMDPALPYAGQQVAATLREWGLSSARTRPPQSHESVTVWTKRKAA